MLDAERHRHWQIDENKTNYLIKYLYNLIDSLTKNKAEVTFRYDYFQLSLFSNDVSLIQTLVDSGYNWKISRVQPSPDGVIYFSTKTPPGKYRTYFTPKANQYSEELKNYLSRTPDVKLSPSWHRYIKFVTDPNMSSMGGFSQHQWAKKGIRYLDYTDERNLMMMQLLFSDAVGKTYKLEKKPS
jgi:hypothetical protein